MDYYFSAADDAAALCAKDLSGGPIPGSPGLDSVEAKDVLACPHLEQLVTLATGKTGPSLVPELDVLWPAAPDESFEFVPGASIMRLPDSLRDNLADVEMTSEVAASWADAIWGFDEGHASLIAERIVRLSKAAKSENKSIYWWSET